MHLGYDLHAYCAHMQIQGRPLATLLPDNCQWSTMVKMVSNTTIRILECLQVSVAIDHSSPSGAYYRI